MTTLNGLALIRNPRTEIPVVNLSGATTINAGDVLQQDTTNALAVQYAANPGQVGLPVKQGAAACIPCGVSITDMPPGATGAMQVLGFIQVINSAAGAIAVGAAVAPDAAGQVKTDPTGVPLIGIAWSAGAAQGDLIQLQILITPH